VRTLARLALLAAVAGSALCTPASASAAFGFLPSPEGFDVAIANEDGSAAKLAGSHPGTLRLGLGLKLAGSFADGDLREAQIDLPAGLLVNPAAVPQCSAAQFHAPRVSPYEESRSGESCPDKTQVGVAALRSAREAGATRYFGIFNLTAPSGAPGALGFSPYGVPVVLAPHVREADAGLSLDLEALPQSFDTQRLELELWGVPWSTANDNGRGNCLNETDVNSPHGVPSVPAGPGGVPPASPGTCSVGDPKDIEPRAYLTLPPGPCALPLDFAVRVRSWQGQSASASAQTHDTEGKPYGLAQCNHSLSKAKVQLTGQTAAVGTGLTFTVDVNDGGGILNPGGVARPAIRRAVVALPEGLTINPSVAAGLGACSPQDFADEQLHTAPGQGCPNDSKVGDVLIEGMLGLPQPIQGALHIAEPYDNPFGTLLALYIVARDPERGLLVKSVGKVEPDPRTGRLLITFEELPRLLYQRFTVSLREGQRAMLVSPPGCGSYDTSIDMSSWAASDPPSHETNAFAIVTGPTGACPPPGAPPFAPGLVAGSTNPNAAAYSPVYLRMTRTDAEQAIVSYSAKLPPGLLAKIAGTSICPEASIAAAKQRSAVQEQASPSCPDSSKIGRTLVGGGVGRTLAYAPGALYLAGPHNGSPLSVVAITAAKIGPFDLGTVVVRATPRFDSQNAQVVVDATRSDPIPHILAGIPIHVRDIRVYVDRPNFTLNPTSCDPFAFTSILGGAGADPFSRADDVLAASSDRFQLLNCSALGFRPRLNLQMKGGTRRNEFPSLRALYVPRPGDANLKSASATLPGAFFLEQGHIRSICSNTQFAAAACPPSSVYGYARAFTPLLQEPLQGPVYLRSSKHRLPDLVADLKGLVEVEVAGRVDSSRGGLRASFENLPDAPVSKFILTMKGGKKGLVVNSRNTCQGRVRAQASFTAQNAKVLDFKPLIEPQCGKKGKRKPGRS
jgi:hypothetical protein